MELIHYTNVSNLPNILKSGKILDNLARGKMQVIAGEGNPTRKCCYPTYSYNNRPYKCDETCSVFMRVRKPDQPFVKPFGKKVAIIFDAEKLLKGKKGWHINFCENNGFWINDNKAPMGDEDAHCPNSSNKYEDIETTPFNHRDAEIVFYKPVSLKKHLLRIVDRTGKEIPIPTYSPASKTVAKSLTQRQPTRSKSRSKSKSRKTHSNPI